MGILPAWTQFGLRLLLHQCMLVVCSVKYSTCGLRPTAFPFSSSEILYQNTPQLQPPSAPALLLSTIYLRIHPFLLISRQPYPAEHSSYRFRQYNDRKHRTFLQALRLDGRWDGLLTDLAYSLDLALRVARPFGATMAQATGTDSTRVTRQFIGQR